MQTPLRLTSILLLAKTYSQSISCFLDAPWEAAVAIELATRKPCEKLIVESTFTSIQDMAQEIVGPIPSISASQPIRFVIENWYDSYAAADHSWESGYYYPV